MEVAVAEEKRKIFRARKTMKISDRQQLETLHNTLLTGNPPISNPSPPPLVNGTHKEDGRKAIDKEQNEAMDSNSSHAPSPGSQVSQGSPTPSLSLNLSPSPSASQSPKANEENPSTSPFHSLNIELKKMEEGKKESLTSPPNEVLVLVSTEPKEGQDKSKEQTTGKAKADKKEEPHPTTENKIKDSTAHSSVLPAVSAKKSEKDLRIDLKCPESMETNRDTKEAKAPDVKPKRKVETASRAKAATSMVPGQNEEMMVEEEVVELKGEPKDERMKEKETVGKEQLKKGSKVEKTDVDVKVETKTEKNKLRPSAQASRPSSTPPSDTVSQEKSSTSGLKRTLSEGDEKNKQNSERDVKRPKVDGMELEAQLEVKITAKGGNRLKLEKIVKQLVEDQLMVWQLNVFDKNLQELKDRVGQIDCANKHQTAIKTLQAKMTRLTKKFGEANQVSENPRKQDVVTTAAAAAAAAAVAAAAAAAPATSTKTTTAVNAPPSQRVLRRQTVEPQPEAPKEGLAPSIGKTPALSVKKKMKEDEKKKVNEEREQEEQENPSVPRRIPIAERLSEHSEGKCRGDIKLRSISSHMERMLYHSCKSSSGKPRAYRYASYIFRNLVPYEIYCDWVSKVNYIGLLGKDALPVNVRKTLRMYVERRFAELSCESWREIRDSINEILRVKRKPEFFRSCEERTAIYS